jgi:hypothetical protein
MPMVRRLLDETEPGDYRFSDLVLGIVESVPFQYRVKAVGSDAGA